MTLGDLLTPRRAIIPLKTGDLAGAVSALAKTLDLPGGEEARLAFEAAVLAREAAGSTGIGKGVAIPHARAAALDGLRLAAGLAKPPVDFKSADAKPVSLIFLLATPESQPSAHLKALAALSRAALDAKLVSRLNKAESPAKFSELLASVAL